VLVKAMVVVQSNDQKLKNHCRNAVAVKVKFPLAPTFACPARKLLHALQPGVVMLLLGQH